MCRLQRCSVATALPFVDTSHGNLRIYMKLVMGLRVTGYLPLYFQGYRISILLSVICHNVILCSILVYFKGYEILNTIIMGILASLNAISACLLQWILLTLYTSLMYV